MRELYSRIRPQLVMAYVNCKVCLSDVVGGHKGYAADICEPCQNFFRRCCRGGQRLVCISGTNSCIIDASSRRLCRRCRFERCLANGMRSKHLPGEMSSDESTTPTKRSDDNSWTFKSEANSPVTSESSAVVSPMLMPQLVRDPTLFDGCALEAVLRNSAQAFTQLHAYHFLPLIERTEAIDDRSLMVALGAQQIQSCYAVSASYSSFFSECENLSIDDLDILRSGFMTQLGVLFNALPGNPSSSLCGVNSHLLQTIVQHFPPIQEAVNSSIELAAAIADWNPSFLVTSVLFGLLLFNEKALLVPKLARVRRRLWMALELYCGQYPTGHKNSVEEVRRQYEKCLLMIKKSVNASMHSMQMVQAYDPSVSPVFAYMTEEGAIDPY